jgi:hypothetical protein
MTKIKRVAFWGLIFCFHASSQVLDTLWSRDLSAVASVTSYAQFLAKTSDGGFIVGGGSSFPSAPSWIVKTDAKGKIAWNYSNATNEPLCGIATGGGQNYYVANQSSLVKIDSTGATVWKKALPFTNQSFSGSVCACADGGFFVGGKCQDSLGGGIVVLKFDPSGAQAWDQRFPLPLSQMVAMAPGPANGALLAVKSVFMSPQDTSMVIALKNYGAPLWSKTIAVTQPNQTLYIYSFVKSQENRYVLSGEVYSNTGTTHGIIVWLDGQGNVLRDSLYLPSLSSGASTQFFWEYFSSITPISPNSYLVCGSAGFAFMDSVGTFTRQSRFGGYPCSAALPIDNEDFIVAMKNKIYSLKVNYPPFFLSTPGKLYKELLEDKPYRDSVFAADYFPGDVIRYFVLSSTAKGLIIDTTKGVISWLPSTDKDSGVQTISLLAMDRVGQTDTLTYQVHVTAVNDTPVINRIVPQQTVYYEGDTVKVSVVITDEENGPFQYVWIVKGNDTISTSSTASFATNYSSAGKYPITVVVKDAKIIVTRTDTIVVLNKPLPPEISNPSNTPVCRNSFLTWGWHKTPQDPDLDVHTLEYSLQIQKSAPTNPSGALMVNAITDTMIQLKTITGIDSFVNSTFQVRLSCFDGNGYSPGWSAYKYFTLVNDSLVQTATIFFDGNGQATCQFKDGAVYSFKVTSGNYSGASITLTYFGYMPSPVLAGQKTVYCAMSSTLRGNFQVMMQLSRDSLQSNDIFAAYIGNVWTPMNTSYDANTHTISTTIAQFSQSMTIPKGILSVSEHAYIAKGAPQRFSVKMLNTRLNIGIPLFENNEYFNGTLSVYNVKGRCVEQYPVGNLRPGYYSFDFSKAPAGKYFAIFKTKKRKEFFTFVKVR